MISKNALKKLIKTEFNKTSLHAWLIRRTCENDNAFDFLIDITEHGCNSGIVPEIIYTRDCIAFYERFETDIWKQVSEFLQSTGQSLGEFLDGFSNK